MRADWDERARKHFRFFIATGAAASDEAFRESGIRDIENEILDGCELGPTANVVEIGAGVGRLVVPLSHRVGHVVGVDISPVMIAESAAFCADRPNVRMEVVDGRLPVEDSSQDFVFSYIVFQHVPEESVVVDYINEASRALRPGGVFRFQVDGRLRLREQANWKPGTYDGVKLASSEVHEFLRKASLSVVTEWGAETHYHWFTAVKPGQGARVRIRPRQLSRQRLEDAFRRCGVVEPVQSADAVIKGRSTVRREVTALEERMKEAEDSEFVAAAVRALMGMEAASEDVALTVDLLRTRDDDRPGVIDSLVSSRGFRDMVYPIVPRVPWFRIEGAFGSEACRESLLREEAGVFELAYRFSKSIEGLTLPDALREAFVAIVGHEPDAAARRHYESLVTTKGPYRLVEELLLDRELTPRPAAPPEARTRELRARFSLGGGAETAAGESFPGERKIAQRLLDDLRQASTETFVYEAFKGVLGRNVDGEGASYYIRRIEGREMNRPLFLRELLWSEELRRE